MYNLVVEFFPSVCEIAGAVQRGKGNLRSKKGRLWFTITKLSFSGYKYKNMKHTPVFCEAFPCMFTRFTA